MDSAAPDFQFYMKIPFPCNFVVFYTILIHLTDTEDIVCATLCFGVQLVNIPDGISAARG